jgi:hypothetical protein
MRATRRISAVTALALAATFLTTTPRAVADGTADEFVGPFATWADVKRDYHAIGDGQADDTAPIQRALDELRRTADLNTRTVLYIPAGTYRLTRGLTMTSHIYVSVIGEDPSRTTFRWDGPEGGTMLACNGVRYSSFGRLTWDGQGKALMAIAHLWDGKTPNANSGCEHADEVFKDVGIGLRAGIPPYMDAECAVHRCRFERCSRAGVGINSFNALDWWLWHCRFEDCRVGATNCLDGEYGGGHFHVYESEFRGSTEADITIGHANYFGIRNNTSIASKAFFIAKRPAVGRGTWAEDDTWGAQMKLQGNRILDPQDSAPIRVSNSGPLVLLDNVIRGRPWADGTAVELHAPGKPDLLAIGNTFTVPKPFAMNGRLREIDTKIVKRADIADNPPILPSCPPRRERTVYELNTRAGAGGIQSALNAAAKLTGQRPVIHLAPGTYLIDRSLIIPPGADLQLIGDGERTALCWTGRGSGPVIQVTGPCHARLSDFSVWGSPTRKLALGSVPPVAIAVDGCDQQGGRILADQVWARGLEFGFKVGPLRYTAVQLIDSYPRSNSPQGVMLKVDGSRVTLIGGASSGEGQCFAVDGGGELLVRDTWYEGPSSKIFHLSGTGSFTLDGSSLFSSPPGGLKSAPLVVDGFRGKVTILGVKLSGDTWMTVRGDSSETEVLLAGTISFGRDVETAPGKYRFVAANNRRFYSKPKQGTASADDRGADDIAFIRALLAQDREARTIPLTPVSENVSDIRLHRVWLETALGGGLQIGGQSAGGNKP